MLGVALTAGAVVGTTAVAGAATSHAAHHAAATASAGQQPPAGRPDPATMTHGPGETLLTGSDLASATAAATAAEPGATVLRAETDSSGDATYEVHMTKADGSTVTVELNSSFAVTGTKTGFGPGPAGSQPSGTPPTGTPPAGAPHFGTPPPGAPSTSHWTPASPPTGLADHTVVGQLRVAGRFAGSYGAIRPAVVCKAPVRW